MKEAVKQILEAIGEDPTREGLLDTPKRFEKSMLELCSGYKQDPQEILAKSFDMSDCDDAIQYNGLILLSGIEFHSLCEHHILPVTGVAHVGYIPKENGKVVGLSKLARLVDVFARRLQCQERMTQQIADALNEAVDPDGVIVVVEAEHFCVKMRGVRKQNSTMKTISLHGSLIEVSKRDEALKLIYGQG
jgi:GTP cyclohydrolase I